MLTWDGTRQPIHEVIMDVVDRSSEPVVLVELPWQSAAVLMQQIRLLPGGRDDEAVLWTQRGAVTIRPVMPMPQEVARFYSARGGVPIAEARLTRR